MKKIKFLPIGVWLLVLITFASCEDDVKNLRDLDFSPRLVVNAYIAPALTTLKVQLQTTQPGVGVSKTQDQLRVTNATVTMSDGVSTVALAYNHATDAYETSASNLPVEAGKTYFLKVTTPGGYKAEASCVVPSTDGISLSELNHSTSVSEWNPDAIDHQFSYKWTDAPNTANYYQTLAYLVIRETNLSGNIETMTQPFYLNDDELKGYFTDQGKSGSLMLSPRFYTSSFERFGSRGKMEYDVHALLLVADQHYYKYHQSMVLQSRSDGNPFAEPTFVYSNIQGGIGVFGAYNTVDAFITVK